jgi:dTDP-4-amino-4,6-dideoxygalactose transaminase
MGSQQLETMVPFVDLEPIHAQLKAAILDEIAELIDTGAFVNGPQIAAFEEAFAAYCGSSHCVGVSSGIDALRLALEAGGIEQGDEVIVPAHTFVATFAAVTQVGGRPVPVDVSEDDYCLDPARVGGSARFLMPVHLYGQMADMQVLEKIAVEAEMTIVEDACQAHGASRDGWTAGTVGAAGAFSFYPSKNLGAMGDAGALITDDAEIAERARILREHGQTAKYHHEAVGYTARLDTLQAIVLLHKLELLDEWIEQRRAAARFYTETLAGVGDLRLPSVARGSEPAWHLYVVRTEDPSSLGAYLAGHGIGTGRHYPEPPHLSPAFSSLGYARGDFPVAEAIAEEGLSVPLFPGITEEQLDAVAAAIVAYFG